MNKNSPPYTIIAHGGNGHPQNQNAWGIREAAEIARNMIRNGHDNNAAPLVIHGPSGVHAATNLIAQLEKLEARQKADAAQ